MTGRWPLRDFLELGALPGAVPRGLSDRGQHLEAFYACLYYAALRPSEAVMLREVDLYLPAKGWGRIVLAASASREGRSWTDHGTARQERGLKHRAAHETRTIPIPPDLVRLLLAHIKKYGTTPDGRSSRLRGAGSFRTRPTAPCGPRPGRTP
jgi:integrase